MKSYILRLLISIFAITYIFILSGCDKKNETNILFSTSDESANIIDVITETYSDKNMFKEIDTEKYTLDELNKIYPIEFAKKHIIEGDLHFNIAYITSSGYIILYYDESGNYIFGENVTAEKLLKDFDALNIGDSIDDVEKFDENGSFPFLYAGYTGTPKISFHYTIDGYMVMIHYDSDYVITEIENRLI